MLLDLECILLYCSTHEFAQVNTNITQIIIFFMYMYTLYSFYICVLNEMPPI